jgi:hypothetical protein
LERLKREAEASLQEAQGLAAKLNTSIDTFEEHCRRIINESLRIKLVQEINEVTSAVIKRVHDEVRKLELYPAANRGKVVWIQGMHVKSYIGNDFDFSPFRWKSQSASKVAEKMEAEHSDVRYASTEAFERRINSLKSLILAGGIDDVLGLNAKEVLWEVMGRNGKLVSTLDRRDVQKEGISRYGYRRVLEPKK